MGFLMDRPNARGVPFGAAQEPVAAGWDSHQVWRERVRDSRRVPEGDAPAISFLTGSSAGWDPLETWRLRVKRARRTDR